MDRSLPEILNMTLSGLNLITQAISIYDEDLKLVIVNTPFKRMFDLPENLTTAGAAFEDTIRYLAVRGDYGPIDDLETFIAERSEQARTFEPHYLERTRANGTTITIEGSPLRQGGWVAVYSDITSAKQQEALLRDRSANLSEELLARSEELSKTNRNLTATITALEEAKRDLTASQDQLNLTNAMTPAHIARVDKNGVYSYSNRKLASVLPGRPNKIVGMTFAEALGEDVHATIAPAFARTLNGEAPVLEFEHKETGRFIRLAFTPDRSADGPIEGAYLLSMDVTEEVNARQALTHTRRRELAAQLTSGLAHDFSNLLTIILGQNERLLQLDTLPPEAADIAATIKAAAKRGGTLLDGLSQLDTRRPLQIRPAHIASFVDGFRALSQAAIPEDIALTIQNDITDPYLMLDEGFAQDTLLNLTLNAVDAINGAGEIDIHLRKAGAASFEITVQDDGPGFSDEALKTALAPFYTTKADGLGRGLGLSSAFDFAKSSNGNIRLANAPAGGARVTIRLPYLTAEPPAPGLVLLIEDSEDVRQTIRGYLQRMGHAVIEADNMAEALTLIKLPDITYIVTDLMLGNDGTGFDLLQKLRANGNDLPALVITGLDATNSLRQTVERSYPVLQKPFDYNALAAHLQGTSHGG